MYVKARHLTNPFPRGNFANKSKLKERTKYTKYYYEEFKPFLKTIYSSTLNTLEKSIKIILNALNMSL
jgi:hypothetical protein